MSPNIKEENFRSVNSSRLMTQVASWSPPLLWGVTILLFSGDLGSSQNTMGIIRWLLSGIPDVSPEMIAAIHWSLRKLGHMSVYGVLFFLWFRAFSSRRPEHRPLCLLLAMMCTLTVALLDEGHQAVIGSRRGSFTDVGWDLAGAVLSTFLILAFRQPKAGEGKLQSS